MASKQTPISIANLDEIGYLLADMANPRSATGQSIAKVLLEFFSVSDWGNVFDPMIYADSDKNTNPLASPNLTIIGTTTPAKWNVSVSDHFAEIGLLGRIFQVENLAEIPTENMDHNSGLRSLTTPVLDKLKDFAAHILTLAQKNECHDVLINDDAKAHFHQYSEFQRQKQNAYNEGPAKEVWNRISEKAKKLAATWAISRNYKNPVVTIEIAQFATDFVTRHTQVQFTKFANGDVGEMAGNEAKQQSEVVRIIREYVNEKDNVKIANYGVAYEIHRDGVIPESYISRRLIKLPAFAKDRIGATASLKRTIKSLLEADELREMPPAQMIAKYGSKPRSYVIANPGAFR